MAVLEVNHVTKRFGKTVAVDDATFSVKAGEILSLLGPSGCGKTTTLRMISGFESPEAGNIVILGEPMKGKRPYERNVGLLFQDYALFPHMTVEQNVGYGLKQRNYERSKRSARIQEMLELVKLSRYSKRRPSQLSGGQQQRIALARALATSPAVVLLDEPLSALDAKLREELRIELKEILNSVGATTIVVTHDQEEAMSLGDSVIVMERGRIVQEGAPTEIYSDPKSKFVAEFIGRSNWFAGKITGELSPHVVNFKASKDLTIMVPEPPADMPASDIYEVCVRPERIQVLREGKRLQNENACWNKMEGKIRQAAHLGSDIQFVVEIQGQQQIIVTEQYSGQNLEQKGRPVTIAFRPEDCIIVPADT